MADILFKEESYRITGACFEVYKEMGSGFVEPVYQECLEIKAVKQLTDEHRAQVHNYLKATGPRLGLLVNLGHYPKVEWERDEEPIRRQFAGEEVRNWYAHLLQALGYTGLDRLDAPVEGDDAFVPVVGRVNRDNQPWLLVCETHFRTAVNEGSASGNDPYSLESPPLNVSWKIDDGQRTVTKTFYPPFTKVDREGDYLQAWEVFQQRFGE